MSSPKAVIYQLVVRYFGNTNLTNAWAGTIEQNGCGRFVDINEAAIEALRALGVTHVWLTGVLRQATLTDYSSIGLPADDPDIVKGRAGSFYAVRDYFDVCPDYAADPARRMQEFEALVGRLHAAGLKVLIDLVPNHVARSYDSVTRPDLSFGAHDDRTRFFARDNSFFYLVDPPNRPTKLARPPEWNPPGVVFDGAFAGEDGSPEHPPKATGDNLTTPNVGVNNWYETIKLNYGFNFTTGETQYDPPPRTWGIMNEIIRFWQGKGVDGFRCDFAHFVPAEFWSFLIRKARLRDPETYFIAEAYPWQGSGDPVTARSQLVDAGFDSVYNDASYHTLKRIYQCTARQEDYDSVARSTAVAPHHLAQYLENHDERRIASPLSGDGDCQGSGFGSADAGYQLAPLQYLHSKGAVIVHNGQEVGETGAGIKGFNRDEGRTTVFDYWCMPEFARWVNGHAYDGGGLLPQQHALRRFYADLLALCQDPSITADGYWGLKYFNDPERVGDCPADLYSFARFAPASGRLLLIVANFRAGATTVGQIHLPTELVTAAGLTGSVAVSLVLTRSGRCREPVAEIPSTSLTATGFRVSVPVQSTHVYAVEIAGSSPV